MPPEARKTVGEDIKTVQYGWPLDMPLVRKMEPGLWEVRSTIGAGIARVLFTTDGPRMVLLHGFIKKTDKTPKADLRWLCAEQTRFIMAKHNVHIGSALDDLLAEDGVLEEVSARAIKRVIAWQLREAMQAQGVTKTVMAQRMHTSRSMLDRLLDDTDTGLTIDTLSRAAQALGYRVKVELAAA